MEQITLGRAEVCLTTKREIKASDQIISGFDCVILTLFDERQYDEVMVKKIAETCVAEGISTIICYGQAAEFLHDAIDDILLGDDDYDVAAHPISTLFFAEEDWDDLLAVLSFLPAKTEKPLSLLVVLAEEERDAKVRMNLVGQGSK